MARTSTTCEHIDAVLRLLLGAALLLCSVAAQATDSCQASADDTYRTAATGATQDSFKCLLGLPGATRSVVKQHYALITPESRVTADLPGWTGVDAACVVSPGMGAHFSMYIATSRSGVSASGSVLDSSIERFLYVLQGTLTISGEKLRPGGFVYLPPGDSSTVAASEQSSFLVYDRVYDHVDGSSNPQRVINHELNVSSEVLAPEVFVLRRLLPRSPEYDFNVHVMDFQPGEHLIVKEVHYNQHGLLLLQGQGIYLLGEDFYPVTAGDVIYMGPFVPQWFGALGTSRSRYIIYKDTNRDPLKY